MRSSESTERYVLIDNLRGLAFIFMIIHHIFYFYDASNNTSYANNDFVNTSGTIARTIFIFLVGCSLVIAYKKNGEKFNNKRLEKSLLILVHALIITFITYIYYPDRYIRFGVLHFIALATFLLSFIVPYPKLYIIILIVSLLYKPPVINPFIDVISGSRSHFSMMDWFPLNKWLPLVLVGMISMDNLDLSRINIPLLNNENILTWIGKNCLNLYTIHIVFLILLYNQKIVKI